MLYSQQQSRLHDLGLQLLLYCIAKYKKMYVHMQVLLQRLSQLKQSGTSQAQPSAST